MPTKTRKSKKANEEANLPEFVYVTREEPGSVDSYLAAWDDLDGPDAGSIIGKYQLVRKGSLARTTTNEIL